MIAHTLAELAAVTGGRAVGSAVVSDLTTDSRDVPDGSVFLALRGDNHDGHDYVAAAAAAGAVGAVVDSERALGGLPGVVVDDTEAALGNIAANLRRRLDVDVIAITGSVGKTTTKDLTAAAIGARRNVVAARGSYNNEVGVPLTLLRLTPQTDVAVVEVGARGVGHIASLVPIISHDVAIVTAVAGAHLEQFGDLDTVARAKSELVTGLGRNGVAVLNADDQRVATMAARHPGPRLFVSAAGDQRADLAAENIQLDQRARASFDVVGDAGRARVRLPMAGRHHVGNALLALAAATAVDVELDAAAAALADAGISSWRSEVHVAGDVVVLNDAYNANGASMLAALQMLAAQDVPGRRWAVLGVMAELGQAHHDTAHRDVGAACVEHGVDRLVVVGEEAAGIAAGARDAGLADVVEVAAPDGAREAIADVAPGDAVLFKASRVAGLERVAARLLAELGEASA